tara:strand:- start:330 stop:1124 length:795 start_codon:yes stop_codon:yes gene_type:complete
MASTICTKKLLKYNSNRISLIVIVSQIPGSFIQKYKLIYKLIKKSSIAFAYYKFFESTLFNILIKIKGMLKYKDSENNTVKKLEEIANDYNIKVLETADINNKNILIEIKKFKPEIIFSVMNQIIKRSTFDFIGEIFINAHGSYLPKYRGPAQYIFYLANKDKEFGVTLHFMNEGIDNGNIIMQQNFKFDEYISAYRLHFQMAQKYAFMFNKFLDENISLKNIISFKQSESDATYTRMPVAKDIKTLHSNGNSLIKLKDFINCV